MKFQVDTQILGGGWKKKNRPLVERLEKGYHGVKELVVTSQEWERDKEEVKVKRVRKCP